MLLLTLPLWAKISSSSGLTAAVRPQFYMQNLYEEQIWLAQIWENTNRFQLYKYRIHAYDSPMFRISIRDLRTRNWRFVHKPNIIHNKIKYTDLERTNRLWKLNKKRNVGDAYLVERKPRMQRESEREKRRRKRVDERNIFRAHEKLSFLYDAVATHSPI